MDSDGAVHQQRDRVHFAPVHFCEDRKWHGAFAVDVAVLRRAIVELHVVRVLDANGACDRAAALGAQFEANRATKRALRVVREAKKAHDFIAFGHGVGKRRLT